MIKTILVPIDGSEHARKATILAGDIADKYDAEVVLLHVTVPGKRLPENLRRMAEVEHLVDPNRKPQGVTTGMPGDTVAAVQDNNNSAFSDQASARIGQWLLDQAEKVVREKGVETVSKQLEDGDPVESIIKSAREKQASLVVMGSRGLSDLEGLLLGSVSHKVSQLADCSCITVK